MSESGAFFPMSVKKFMEKGIASLTEEEKMSTLHYLENAYHQEPCNEEIVHRLIQFYNQTNKTKKAQEIGQNFLTMNGYNKEILGELSVTFMQEDNMDTYFTLVRHYMEEEKQEDAKEVTNNVIPFPKQFVPRKDIRDFASWQTAEQLEFLQEARFLEIDDFLPAFKMFLADESFSPFVQSMIFELMQEKEVNEEIEVRKVDKHGIFNPSEVPMLAENAFATELFSGLADKLEHSNPSLLEQIIGIIQQHLFMLYPFEFEPKEVDVWVNAYFKWANSMYGDVSLISDAVNQVAVEEAISIIEELEIRQQNYFI
ncbi:hypothetical protein MXK52_05090 [Listeria innocua]|uniref:hypothetical protein n=1 Tax=Listeria innocua TaxID=1642 RepID=UPI0001EBB90D|nr:hypothetical protein [Listeria innocua]OET32814.1 hypothetical protein AJL15_09025 [Listeria monocytogenes]EFR94094.1 conserved hypothetical protein [Listeria innocua FSL J1-023]MBC6117407.1 hypothetical protein [Listeria innocua]MBC6138986.1 hypothetical protein [Listeria innocua]UVD66914.1 hypothetical protein MXK52_05090 [Listeria innocua]